MSIWYELRIGLMVDLDEVSRVELCIGRDYPEQSGVMVGTDYVEFQDKALAREEYIRIKRLLLSGEAG
jgi:hypothetical protein